MEKRRLVYYVKVSYEEFKFYNSKEATIFAETVMNHGVDFHEDSYTNIRVEYEYFNDKIEDLITEITDIDD